MEIVRWAESGILAVMPEQELENVSLRQMNLARTEIFDRLLKAHSEWSGRLLTLSSAAITLLFSFRNSYLPDNPIAGWLLPLSLGCFAISILCAVLGCFHQTICHLKVHKQLNTEMMNCMEERKRLTEDDLSSAIQRSRHLYEIRPIGATAIALIFFTLAMMALSLFAILNWKY